MNRKIIIAGWIAVCVCARGALVINEVCYDNKTLTDETGDASSDWIELYNTGPAAVNLQNYGLADANPYEEAKGVRLPNYSLAPGGFLVVYANSDLPEYTVWTNAPDIVAIPENSSWRYSAPASAPAATWKDTAFNDAAWASGISPMGYNDATLDMDCATLLSDGDNPDSRYPTAYFRKTFRIVNPSVVTGLSVRARINDGMVLYLNGVEQKRVNMPDGAVSYSTHASMSVPSTFWTNFVLSATGLVAGNNVLAVEVHQASAGSVDLIMDMSVTALVNEQVPMIHGQFGLSKTGENVHLFNHLLSRIHKFDGPASEPGEDKSYGLATDGVTSVYKVYEKPTPGLPNATNSQKYSVTLHSQKPTFSVAPGFYAANQSVVLSTPLAGYRIYYTLDGSDPWDSSTYVPSGQTIQLNAVAPTTSGLSWIRTNPVEIGETVPDAAWQPPVGSVPKAVVIRAIAVDGTGKFCSPETSGTYFIGSSFATRTLPTVSIITDADNLFGFTSGIYVPGKYYADSTEGYGDNKWGKPHANYHQSDEQLWERPVQLEFFETTQNTAAFSSPLGMAMHGGGTRAIPQKSLYLMARLGEYGTDLVDYPLFPDENATSYKRFLLRNNGNDWYGPISDGISTMLKDAVFHRIAKGLNTSVMAYRPVTAYVNGEYWGIHNLRESFDKHYLATRYGLDADNVDLLMHEEDELDNDKVKITRIDGDKNSDEEYEELIDWIQANPLSIDANYERVQTSAVFTNALDITIGGIDATNHADYIIAETFFANTDWPVNNCDFWRAHTNQTATCGEFGDTRWRWMFYDLDVAGEKGADFDMLEYLSSSKMTGGSEPGFLINQLWSNMNFRNYFVTRYVNLLNTTFRPERMAAIISEAADVIAPEVESHFLRWGKTITEEQWRTAVTNVLVDYTAARHAYSWQHLDNHFGMGGIGSLEVNNIDPSGTGGGFIVNGINISTDTDGVTSRASWGGTFFRSLPIMVEAVPDAGYIFDGWVGTAVTNPSISLFVGESPISLTARFRLASAPAYQPTGYEQWQLANYSVQQILGDGAAGADASSGYAGMSNFSLYAFGMNLSDNLTDAERIERTRLSIQMLDSALWLGYTRLNDTYDDVRYTLKVASSLAAPVIWNTATNGIDLDPVALTNILDASTWYYEVRLPQDNPVQDTRFFKLEAVPEQP